MKDNQSGLTNHNYGKDQAMHQLQVAGTEALVSLSTLLVDDGDPTTYSIAEQGVDVGGSIAAGAVAGSIVPGVGTALGAGVGAVVGAAQWMAGKKAAEAARKQREAMYNRYLDRFSDMQLGEQQRLKQRKRGLYGHSGLIDRVEADRQQRLTQLAPLGQSSGSLVKQVAKSINIEARTAQLSVSRSLDRNIATLNAAEKIITQKVNQTGESGYEHAKSISDEYRKFWEMNNA